MSERVLKDDVLLAIDSDISAADEKERLAGINSWAIAAALVALAGVAASLWETSNIRPYAVATLFLGITFAAELSVSIRNLGRRELNNANANPVLWLTPRSAVIAQRLVLLIPVLYFRSVAPGWATRLAASALILEGLFALLASPGFVVKLASFAAVQKRFTPNGPNDEALGSLAAMRVTQSMRAVIYCTLALAYFRASPSFPQRGPLGDVRFAVVAFLIMLLIGFKVRHRPSYVAVELRKLKHDVLLAETSPSDAAIIMRLLVQGIPHARTGYTASASMLTAVLRCRSEAEVVLFRIASANGDLSTVKGIPELLCTFAAVDAEVSQFLPIINALTRACEALGDAATEPLLKRIQQLHSEHEAFRVAKLAIVTAAQYPPRALVSTNA